MSRNRMTVALTEEQLDKLRTEFESGSSGSWQAFLRAKAVSEVDAPITVLTLLKNAANEILSDVPRTPRTARVVILLDPSEYEYICTRAAFWGVNPALYAARNLIELPPYAYLERAKPKGIMARALQLIPVIEATATKQRKTP